MRRSATAPAAPLVLVDEEEDDTTTTLQHVPKAVLVLGVVTTLWSSVFLLATLYMRFTRPTVDLAL